MHNLKGVNAAQYVRMSTDIQDLSIDIQKKVIGAFAQANEINIVATYEDEARSGLEVKHRKGIQQVLKDVTAMACPFTLLLIYDVTRWGRFEDPDAAAYH